MGVKAIDVVKVMQGWIGTDKRKMIDLYNSHAPLAQGYKVQYTDAWCDTTVSACFIKLNATDLIGGTECGVERHIELFKQKGIWNEDGGVTPSMGDIICYNWDDNTQPNDGFADHIGIVESVSNGQINVIEGNYNDAVRRRTIPVGWGYIRGYAQPKYDAQEEPKTVVKTHLNGIDVASYQGNINTGVINADFVIVKATQGNAYINPYFHDQIDKALNGGKIVGLYHYATGIGVDAEVSHFLGTVKSYIGKAFLCLDWETSTSSIGNNSQFYNPDYAKQFMDRVREKTGLIMFLYGSKDSCCNAMDWTAVKDAGYPLWGAQYKDMNPVDGYQANPWQSSRPWGAWGQNVAIHQYTPALRLLGYTGDLDGNICYLTAEQLKAYATPTIIKYRTHCQTYGWMAWVSNGEWSGTTGKAKRLEAIQINPPEGVELEIVVHLQKIGDKPYCNIVHGNNIVIGTTGESRRMEGISIRCTKNTTGLTLKYQGHRQTYGDTKICSDGEYCGTRGESKRLEAIRIWFE